MLQTLRRPTLKVWNKEVHLEDVKKEKVIPPPEKFVPKKRLTASRLSDLSLIVDTGGAYREEIDEF